MRQRLMALIVAGLLVLLALPAATTAAECEFILGFASLKALIDAAEGPDKVGDCLENQRFNPENGDALQQTTGGLLVWRKADNWTAFTDGYRTWLNGPHGLQARLNTEQFDWELPPAAIPVPTVEIRTEYIVQCSNGIVVRNPQANLSLVADCAALLQGRDTLDGEGHLLNWSANRNIADWLIVTVSGSPRRVTALQWSPHPKMDYLVGAIPPELGALTSLRRLELDGANRLTGPIPPKLGALTNLSELDLSGNQLTGPIPLELASLAHLSKLGLHDNQLTGTIPPRLGAIVNLRWLSLGDNALIGCLPEELFFAELFTNAGVPRCGSDYIVQCSNGIVVPNPQDHPGLVEDCTVLLRVRDTLAGRATLNWSVERAITDWDGITDGGYSSGMRVTTLNLSQRQLTGSIPPLLGALQNLGELDLRGNQLTGPIPPQLGSLADLQVLSLGFNRLTGTVPAQFEFGDLAIEHFAYLTGLRSSSRHHHPRHWGALRRLERLDLSHNQLTGPIPPQLGSLSSLEVLLLDRNRLTGCLPLALRGVPTNDLAELGLPFCES